MAKLTPSRGFSAELATALVILISSQWGLPNSSSQCLVGAIVGVGLLEGKDTWPFFCGGGLSDASSIFLDYWRGPLLDEELTLPIFRALLAFRQEVWKSWKNRKREGVVSFPITANLLIRQVITRRNIAIVQYLFACRLLLCSLYLNFPWSIN